MTSSYRTRYAERQRDALLDLIDELAEECDDLQARIADAAREHKAELEELRAGMGPAFDPTGRNLVAALEAQIGQWWDRDPEYRGNIQTQELVEQASGLIKHIRRRAAEPEMRKVRP